MIRHTAILLSVLALALPAAVHSATAQVPRVNCDDNGTLCTERSEPLNYEGNYTGHDEPSVLFYSNKPGSGNSNRYLLRLPKDSPIHPNQSGTGGTWNFQLHPAFWFGMAMCDDQSAPNPGGSSVGAQVSCTPDSDANIFDGAALTAADYIGKHPGTGFMEMQFYPPGWVAWPPGISCDATHWCAALNIDSVSENYNTGKLNNASCLNATGVEYVNFAFITSTGVPLGPPDPLNQTLATFTPDLNKMLLMNPGDLLAVELQDTPAGFTVIIRDLTSGGSGFMTASIANGFGVPKFDPNAVSCTDLPYAFHPMYATSSEHTRVPWAAHSYNVAFADEIGHFEYCAAVDANGNCTSPGPPDATLDSDDNGCFPALASTLIPITGCIATENDFDGVPYQLVWPGTNADVRRDSQYHSQPVRFTSPTFNHGQNYDRVAFETDLPRIEVASTSPNNNCNRKTGAGCVNPPVGANFYPIFSTAGEDDSCYWQLGGPFIRSTTNSFGGTSALEYGPLLSLVYPGGTSGSISRYNDFRQVLSYNPCRRDD